MAPILRLSLEKVAAANSAGVAQVVIGPVPAFQRWDIGSIRIRARNSPAATAVVSVGSNVIDSSRNAQQDVSTAGFTLLGGEQAFVTFDRMTSGEQATVTVLGDMHTAS